MDQELKGEPPSKNLLPIVKDEAIEKTAFSFKEDDLYRARNSNLPLFRHLLSRNLQEFFGGFLMRRMLNAEAEKLKVKIPEPTEDTIREYDSEKTKAQQQLMQNAGIQSRPNTPEEMREAHGKLAAYMKKVGYPPSESFAKYKAENPALMDFFALKLMRRLSNQGYSPLEIASIQSGSLRTYEIIRLQAEKDQNLR